MRSRAYGLFAGLGVVSLLVFAGVAPAVGQDVSTARPSLPAAGEVITLGADREVFRDDFATVGNWWVEEDDLGSVEDADGTLRFSTKWAPSWRTNWRELGTEAPVLWVRVAVALKAMGGAGGPLCGVSVPAPALLFGAISTEGDWIVGRTMDDSMTVLARGPLPPSIDLAQGGTAIVSLECAMTDGSGGRVAVWVDGMNVADVSLAATIGPFTHAGVFSDGYVEGFQVAMDDIVVATGAAYDPRMRVPPIPAPVPAGSPIPAPVPAGSPIPAPVPAGSPIPAPVPAGSPIPAPVPAGSPIPVPSTAAGAVAIASPTASAAPFGDLISHLPAAFSGNCQPREADPSTGLMEALKCAPAGEVDSAAYFRFDSVEALDTAFERLLTLNGAVTDGTDCSVGPAILEYTIGDQPAGRLACYKVYNNAFAQWSNRDLLVMVLGGLNSGDFGTLFRWWQDAGPLP